MRLFVAAELESGVAQAIASCAAELRRRSARAPRARITWVAPGHLHVTVRFIGEAEAAQVETIVAALSPALPMTPFELAIAGVGTFPEHGAPRVLWAGIAAGAEALGAVEAEVSARLDRCGVPREARAYHPHVTLARVREPGGLRTAEWLDGVTGRPFGVSPVNAITLFESRPSRQGPAYVALLRTVLVG